MKFGYSARDPSPGLRRVQDNVFLEFIVGWNNLAIAPRKRMDQERQTGAYTGLPWL